MLTLQGGIQMVFDQVKSIIVEELGTKEELVTMEARLSEDLGADSIDAVELIMKLEDTFDVSVSDEEAQAMTTVKDIVHYLEQKK
jgi:acyl carrier protein|tara:strand:+ start:3211 stop:3465 length:255 start_codon:yes stop_codon:yes gene_type:complete